LIGISKWGLGRKPLFCTGHIIEIGEKQALPLNKGSAHTLSLIGLYHLILKGIKFELCFISFYRKSQEKVAL